MGGGGGILGNVGDDVLNVAAAFIGNALGGPLGAAGADFLTGELEGKGTKGSLENAAFSGVTSGIGDIASGASLTGGGISGLTNSISNIGDSVGNFFSGGAPTTAAGGAGASGGDAIGPNTNLFGTSSPSGVGTGTAIGGTGGGAASAAPASVSGATGGDVTAGTDIAAQAPGGNTFAPVDSPNATGSANPSSTANTGTSVPSSSVGQAFPGTSVPGESSATSPNVSQTTGTPSVSAPSGTTPFSTSAGSANTGVNAATDSLVNGFSASQAASAPGAAGFSSGQSLFPSAGTGTASAVGGAGATPNTIATAFNNPSFSNIASAVGANASPLLAGAGLLGDVAMNKKALPGQKELSNEAGTLAAQGQSLQNYLQTGTLPAGLQGALDSASDSAIATIKSQYAAHGMSGSSAEQDAIAQVKENIAGQGSQMALQLLQTGVSESEGASQLYQSIMNSALSQDNELGAAIGRFATSAAGGTPQANITIGGKNVTV